jgi:membrane protease YdiL (CAAX protease family)
MQEIIIGATENATIWRAVRTGWCITARTAAYHEIVLQADTPMTRGRIRGEVLLVLGLSLGSSTILAIIQLIDLSTRSKSLGHQSTAINTSLSDRQYFDLAYQLFDILVPLVPVALVCYILWHTSRPHLARLGVDFRRPIWDASLGLILVIVIGAGGIGVYLGGRAIGATVDVSAESLGAYWWTIPILLLSALRSALEEEFIVIGYLYARLRELGWGKWTIILSTAVFRGSYHLYQGPGSFAGNFLMGVIFGWLYTRYARLLPFVIAHFLIDAALFIGYPWAKATFPGLL